MHIELQCRHCAHRWALHDDPLRLVALCCPQCQAPSSASRSEDLASSLEDALCVLHGLHRDVHIRVQLDSGALPAAYLPAPAEEPPQGP